MQFFFDLHNDCIWPTAFMGASKLTRCEQHKEHKELGSVPQRKSCHFGKQGRYNGWVMPCKDFWGLRDLIGNFECLLRVEWRKSLKIHIHFIKIVWEYIHCYYWISHSISLFFLTLKSTFPCPATLWSIPCYDQSWLLLQKQTHNIRKIVSRGLNGIPFDGPF